MEVWMPGPDLLLNHCDFRTATTDSRSLCQPFRPDLVEGTPVRIENRDLACVFLPASANYVGVLRIEFHQPSVTAAALASDQGTARSSEQVRYDVTRFATVPQRALY
jgi:hypothetical protein